MRVAPKADTMLLNFGMNTQRRVTSQRVANLKTTVGVAHFVSQKETERKAMHVYDMPNRYIAYIFKKTTIFKRKTSPVTNESVLR